MAVTFDNAAVIQGSAGSTTGGANIVPSGTLFSKVTSWITVNGGNLSLKSTWNIGNTYTDVNGTSGWFWVPQLGTSSSMVVDWGGSTQAWHGRSISFNGADYLPFRANNVGHGTGTPLTVASLTTQQANSLVLANQLMFSSNQVIPTPSPYTSAAQYNDAVGSDRESYETLGAAGTASDLASSTITAANWNSYGIELIGSIASTYPSVLAQLGFPTGTGTTVTLSGVSMTAGDISLAFCVVGIAGQTISVSGTGWSIITQDSTNNLSIAVAQCVSTGTVAAAVFTWGTSATYEAQSYECTGVKSSGPIGAFSVTAGNSATASAAGLTTTAAGSLVLLFGFTTTNNMFSQNPNYYVEVAFDAAGTSYPNSYSLQDTRVATAGTATAAYSQPFVGGVTQPWKIFMLEVIPAVAPVAGPPVPVAIADGIMSRPYIIGGHRAFIKAQ
jgi:hypothetical protein